MAGAGDPLGESESETFCPQQAPASGSGEEEDPGGLQDEFQEPLEDEDAEDAEGEEGEEGFKLVGGSVFGRCARAPVPGD